MNTDTKDVTNPNNFTQSNQNGQMSGNKRKRKPSQWLKDHYIYMRGHKSTR